MQHVMQRPAVPNPAPEAILPRQGPALAPTDPTITGESCKILFGRVRALRPRGPLTVRAAGAKFTRNFFGVMAALMTENLGSRRS
jgi:hypothetical protein